MTSLIEKIIGSKNTATLTLSSFIKIGPNQNDILSPTGIVFIPNISAKSIQKTYNPVSMRSFVSCVVASCDLLKNENIKLN